MSNNPTFQNVKTTRNERVEMRYADSVPQEFDLHQIRRNLPNVVSRGNYGYTLPAEMFHQAFKQFFHLCVGTLEK